MSAWDRAAQFAPFAAVTGHDAAIAETARLTDERIELDETQADMLGQKLSQLQMLTERYFTKAGKDTSVRAAAGTGTEAPVLPMVTVTYFEPDERKEGGAYRQKTGEVKKIDEYRHLLIFSDGLEISLGQITDIRGKMFEEE